MLYTCFPAAFIAITLLAFHPGAALIVILVAIAGGATSGGQAVTIAYSALFYPPAMRAAGQGFAFGMGRLGALKTITAAAHKLARINFHMLATGQACDETIFAQQEVQSNQRMQWRLRRQAKQYGFQLVESAAQ